MEIFFLAVASVAQDILPHLRQDNAESIILFKRKNRDRSIFIYPFFRSRSQKASHLFPAAFFYLWKCIRINFPFARSRSSISRKIEVSLAIIFSFSEMGIRRTKRGKRENDKYSLNRMINIVDTVNADRTTMRQGKREKGK